jgi:uncharacterized protein (UPF0264 family)
VQEEALVAIEEGALKGRVETPDYGVYCGNNPWVAF